MTIEKNLAQIKENIQLAAESAGRSVDSVTLVAATKTNDASRVQEAIRAGIRVCGENRVQEMTEKNAQNAYAGSELHFIGHLQKNKIKQVVGTASLIHSVDSVELLSAIGRAACAKELTQDVLLEVNIAGEESKSGFSAAEIPNALEAASHLPGVRVRGLMAIPPACENPAQNRPFFDAMRQLFIDNKGGKYDNVSMDFLSMGMSGDYTVAIECGSNMVRIGTAIFGPRLYPTK